MLPVGYSVARSACKMYILFGKQFTHSMPENRIRRKSVITHGANRGLTRFTGRPVSYPVSNYADWPEISGGYSYGYTVTPYVTLYTLSRYSQCARANIPLRRL